jgi:hypothetical protein
MGNDLVDYTLNSGVTVRTTRADIEEARWSDVMLGVSYWTDNGDGTWSCVPGMRFVSAPEGGDPVTVDEERAEAAHDVEAGAVE